MYQAPFSESLLFLIVLLFGGNAVRSVMPSFPTQSPNFSNYTFSWFLSSGLGILQPFTLFFTASCISGDSDVNNKAALVFLIDDYNDSGLQLQ